MNVKTLFGASIADALAQARRLFGDDVVLLESVPPADGHPARITVLADAAAARAPEPAPAPAAAPAAAPVGYGYAAVAQATGSSFPQEERAPAPENFSPPPDPRWAPPESADAPPARAGRGRLFAAAPAAVPAAPEPASHLEERLEAQLRLLHERLDRMEQRFGTAVIGASQRWGAHPLFGRLLDDGFRPATVAALFEAAAAAGLAPDADEDALRVHLAAALRDRLPPAAARQRVGTQVFIGPGGSGKTSLLLKLATHPGFYARRERTVLVVLPEDEGAAYQNPVELYRRHGVPVQSVRTEAEMHDALQRAERFDHVLIDTPPIPAQEAAARAAAHRLRTLLAGVMPMEVHFVLDATRALDAFDARYLGRLPLPPALVALTRLDETPRRGRLAEWLMTLDLPVHLASAGPRAPHDLVVFSPTAFAEQALGL